MKPDQSMSHEAPHKYLVISRSMINQQNDIEIENYRKSSVIQYRFNPFPAKTVKPISNRLDEPAASKQETADMEEER